VLQALKGAPSVELFLERTASDNISAEEVYEVLIMDENYPINKIKTHHKFESFNTISA
jgi:hypothetical protein